MSLDRAWDCATCGGDGNVRDEDGGRVEYDAIRDETYGFRRCGDCEGSGSFPEVARLYECPERMACGVLVDGATLRAMLETDLPCKCGRPGRHFSLLPREDEPDHDEWGDALWTAEEIQSWREVI